MLDRLIGVQRQPGQIPAGAILPLRAFLGLTFVYAALSKLTDPQLPPRRRAHAVERGPRSWGMSERCP